MIKVATYSDTCKSIEQHLKAKEDVNVLIRMGGTMAYSKFPVQINSQIGTEVSIDKFKFNQFNLAPIPTEMIFTRDSIRNFCAGNNIYKGIWDFAIRYSNDRKTSIKFIIKPLAKSGGENIFVIDTANFSWSNKVFDILGQIGPFIIQPNIQVTSEYRIHVSSLGEYKITKKVKNNPEDQFITRGNHKVLDIANVVKPRLLNEMIKSCQGTAQKMSMDIVCFDVLYDSTMKDDHMFFIAESNTGPELIGSTKEWYINQINKLIEIKTQ